MISLQEIPDCETIMLRIESEKVIMENSLVWHDISYLVDSCCVPSLSKPYDEFSVSLEEEYKLYTDSVLRRLSDLHVMFDALNKKDIQQPINLEFVTSMLLLTEEMKSEGPWSNQYYSNSYSKSALKWLEIHCNFYDLHNLHIQKQKNIIFQSYMQKIHSKLTKDKWKHYPAALQSYRNFLKNVLKMDKISCPIHLVYPGTFVQLDDYHNENKIEGLKCCSILLQVLEYNNTGYEEVIYETLSKLLRYKDILILEGVMECIIFILPIMFETEKKCNWSKSDDIFELILQDVYMESDSNMKKMYIENLSKLISLCGHSAIRWKKKIFQVICDVFDVYLYNTEDYDIVHKSIQCIISWINVAWPVWIYSSDKEVLIRLYKLLYLLCEVYTDSDEKGQEYITTIEKCIILLLQLCSETQRNEIFNDDTNDLTILGEKFSRHWNCIKNTLFTSSNFDK